MQRYSLWSGLVTWRQGFSDRFVFLGFFFFLENSDVGQDGAKWCDALRRTVCGGCGRTTHATGGGPAVLPREFFCKYKLWEGHYRAIFKGPRKKGYKRFSQKLGKKGFCLKKKVKKGLKGFPGGPVGWPTVRGSLSWAVKMDELHAADHIYIHNFAVFSVRLNSEIWNTRSPRLHWPHSITRSSDHYWSLKMQAIHIRSYPGQRAVYLMPVINIGPWEMCILSTLIFEILQSSTESCPSVRLQNLPWYKTGLVSRQV